MNKLLLLFLFFSKLVFAQERLDSIFTNNGTIAVSIKEITVDAITFSYPGEDLVNSIYKNTVFKIVHKSGRIEKFSEQSSFKLIATGADWENVLITQLEHEVKGLFKLEEVTSKATGATVFSNVTIVKDRAFKKLKIETAMCGGNIVYMLDQQTKGVSSNYGGSDPARTSLSGIAYSNRRPDLSEFEKILSSKLEFDYIEYQSLGNNSTDLYSSTSLYQSKVKIKSSREENGFIMVKTNLTDDEAEEYRVTYFDDIKIVLMSRDKHKIYNYILKR